MDWSKLSRRSWLRLGGMASLAAGVVGASRASAQNGPAPAPGATRTVDAHHAHAMGTVGRVTSDALNPTRFLRTWNFSDLPPERRKDFYRETERPDGSLLREYQIFAVDREIEIAPGIFFPAWAYNGQVPGPTIRATEGDLLRITFKNLGSHPHTIHFHGWHRPEMDGSLPGQEV